MAILKYQTILKKYYSALSKYIKKNNFDLAKTADNFTKDYLRNSKYHKDKLKEHLSILVKLGYVIDDGYIRPTELGLHYRHFRFLYYKNKCITPLFVSIAANILIWLGQTMWPFVVQFINQISSVSH